MIGHRRAAVALHELSDEDRRLILDELPAEDRATLAQHLDELKELGFDDGRLLDDGFSGAGDQSVQTIMPVDRLRAATASEMFALLEGEPSSLIGQLLTIQNWPWADDFLAMLVGPRQDAVRAALSGPGSANSMAGARAEFLVRAVVKRLPKLPASQPNDLIGRAFSPILRLVKSWMQ